MSAFTKIDQKILQDKLVFTVSVEEEGTGKCNYISDFEKNIYIQQWHSYGPHMIITRRLFPQESHFRKRRQHKFHTWLERCPLLTPPKFMRKEQKWREKWANAIFTSSLFLHFYTFLQIEEGLADTTLSSEQVKAVDYNNTPIANMSLHLLVGSRWSARLIQNLTTGDDGIATFTLCTEDMEENIELWVREKKNWNSMCSLDDVSVMQKHPSDVPPCCDSLS